MRLSSWHIGLACGAMFVCARPALSQNAVSDCRTNSPKLRAKGAWAPLGYAAVNTKLAPLIDRRQWAQALDTLTAMFSRPPADMSELSDADRNTITLQIDSTRREIQAAETDPKRRALGTFAERFMPTSINTAEVQGFVLFNGRGTQVVVTDSLNEANRRTVCWLGLAMSDVIAKLRQEGLQRIADAFVKLDASWDNYMNHGYSMLPLELFLNGKLVRRALLEPPRYQVIALHTSVATQMFVTSLKNADRDEVLALEPIGVLRYTDDRRSYRGASLIATFPRNDGIGGGVMIHAGSLGHLALLARRDGNDNTRFGALLSVDLYKRVFGVPDQLKAAKIDKIAACFAQRDKCAELGK